MYVYILAELMPDVQSSGIAHVVRGIGPALVGK
jgi:hypothetical protein